MKRFEPLDHPADIGIIAYGKTEEEIFENAAFGMFSLMADLSRVEARQQITVKVGGEDRESLLINWLNELIYHEEAKKMIFSDFKITKLSDRELEAAVSGDAIDRHRHAVALLIKAATYNQIEVAPDHARVVFDV